MKNKYKAFSVAAFAAVVMFASNTGTAEAACVVKGVYYSDAECIQVKNDYNYSYSYQHSYQNQMQIEMMQRYIEQLLAILERLKDLQASGNYYPTYPSYGNSDVDVTTRSATDIDDDAATLRGRVDFNSEDEATVYFRYGYSRTDLDEETVHVVLDEDDDEEDFSQRIVNLREDRTYYFRAIAEDEDGRKDYGSILSFRTDDDNHSSNDDEPDIDIEDADNVDEDSAKLEGSVDMNDFNNGIVFFIWGEDEDQVKDIEDDYNEYSDIDEDGEDLQKIKVDSDLDGSGDYYAYLYGLDSDTDHYYSLCVEYEDEDDDEVIKCSSVEEFTTDED